LSGFTMKEKKFLRQNLNKDLGSITHPRHSKSG
jgi:hypothetical protein